MRCHLIHTKVQTFSLGIFLTTEDCKVGGRLVYWVNMIYGVVMSCDAGNNIYKMGGKRSVLSLTLCYLLVNTAKMSSQTKKTKLGKYPRIGHACSHSFPVTSLLEAMQIMMLRND